MRDEPNAGLERRSVRPCGAQKGCWSIQTAGRWSWKSKPAKECEKKKSVTYAPNSWAHQKKKKKGGPASDDLLQTKKKGCCDTDQIAGTPLKTSSTKHLFARKTGVAGGNDLRVR